ncbi:hypothetical protein [Carboxylicivirga marina]|uniref:Uncharacterized protein n=1 Tax=Carboxylicivirga marina TaxID=2800988 RepID=A0ABS1HQQ2_9BACT|nr:hypothetical protein [Carboxylicivirga marina]MBK3519976.1 hypothetical protein [Carboxylicivirga marina]
MKNIFIAVILITLYGCNSKTKNSDSTKTLGQELTEKNIASENNNLEDKKQKLNVSNSIINPDTSSNFRYNHLTTFEFGYHKSMHLKKIDEVYFNNILKQIDGFSYNYESTLPNYYISQQNSIHGLRMETIALFWDLCYEGIELLIIDKNGKLLNTISLTEWKSTCESSSNTTTEFVNDSTFIQHIEIMEPGGESNFFTELKYKGLINHKGQLDTLEILINKEYEKEITPHNKPL